MFNRNKQQQLYDETYLELYNQDDVRRSQAYIGELSRIKNFVPSSGAVLDIGCGTGSFLATDKHSIKVFKNYTLFGIEISKIASELAAENGISIINECDMVDDTYDVIIMRGVIQHLPNPLDMISKCYRSLKPGGRLIFLATPNSNSIYYKLWGTLPMLNPKYNFLIPSDTELQNILVNFGFRVDDIVYPYEKPYARPTDYIKFVAKLLGANLQFAFPHNMMEIYATKPTPIKYDKYSVITSLGDLIDSMETIHLKLEHHKDPTVLDRLEEQRKVIAMSIRLIENGSCAFLSFPKYKVYDADIDIPFMGYGDAVNELKKTVRDLWDLQEFVNLKKYTSATREDMLAYIAELDSLNRKRNYLIDRINTIFKDEHQ
jgi:SAM-dependent methyltransferase